MLLLRPRVLPCLCGPSWVTAFSVNIPSAGRGSGGVGTNQKVALAYISFAVSVMWLHLLQGKLGTFQAEDFFTREKEETGIER